LIFYSEAQRILFKDTANREEKKQVYLIFYSEEQRILFKDNDFYAALLFFEKISSQNLQNSNLLITFVPA